MTNLFKQKNMLFKTKLSVKEVILQLQENTDKYDILFTSRENEKPFLGEINRDSFKIRINLNYNTKGPLKKDSLLPVIKGIVYSELHHSKIEATIQHTRHILVIMILSFIITSAPLVLEILFFKETFKVVFPVVVTAFIWTGLTYFLFNFTRKKCIEYFKKILKAEICSDPDSNF